MTINYSYKWDRHPVRFKVGDLVIPSRFDTDAGPMFVERMTQFVGKVGEVTGIEYGHCMVHGYGWPDYALRLSSTLAPPALDFTKPVQTRDGRPVRILCTDKASIGFDNRPVVGLVQTPGGAEALYCWTVLGKFSTESGQGHNDLVSVPPPKVEETRQVWLLRNRANGSVTVHVAGKYDTNEPNTTRNEILARTTITLTEGEGL